jgi:hypothetical protein
MREYNIACAKYVNCCAVICLYADRLGVCRTCVVVVVRQPSPERRSCTGVMAVSNARKFRSTRACHRAAPLEPHVVPIDNVVLGLLHEVCAASANSNSIPLLPIDVPLRLIVVVHHGIVVELVPVAPVTAAAEIGMYPARWRCS